MRRAGWDEDLITAYILEQRLPDWVIGRPDEFEDDDDEEEDDY